MAMVTLLCRTLHLLQCPTDARRPSQDLMIWKKSCEELLPSVFHVIFYNKADTL